MDMTLISKMIKELILDHDTVTLPGLGSVVSEEVSASFSDKGFTINPPYRRLVIRPEEGTDNLLCELYSKSNNISEETARTMISSFLQQVKTMLGEKKTILFPELGLLRATKENNYIFIQDEDSATDPDYFGLNPLSLKNHTMEYEAVPELTEIPKEIPNQDSAAETVPETKKVFKWKWLLWGLFILLFLLVLLRIIGSVAPEYIDRILYTEDELRIIYY